MRIIRNQRRSPCNTPRSRVRRYILFCIVACVSFTCGIAIAEILLWIVAPVPFHEWAIWEPEGHIGGRLVPNQIIHTATGHVFRVNKHGFRGPDYEYQKAAGTLRIEVFGGSAGLCYKAAGREKSWPGALELKLQRRLNMSVEVINLSLAGFTSFDSKINYLCFGRAFDPDAIIVYHTWNDFTQLRRLEKAKYIPRQIPRNKPLWMSIARATQIGRRARQAEFYLRGREMDVMSTISEGTGKDLDKPILEAAFQWEEQNFSDITTWALNDGVLPILVSQACLVGPENIDEPEIRLHMSGGAVQRGFTISLAVTTWLKVNQIIESVAQRLGAIFIDGYNTVPHDLQHVRDNVHLFDHGSEILAEKCARVLMNDPRFLAIVKRVRMESSESVSSPSSSATDDE